MVWTSCVYPLLPRVRPGAYNPLANRRMWLLSRRGLLVPCHPHPPIHTNTRTQPRPASAVRPTTARGFAVQHHTTPHHTPLRAAFFLTIPQRNSPPQAVITLFLHSAARRGRPCGGYGRRGRPQGTGPGWTHAHTQIHTHTNTHTHTQAHTHAHPCSVYCHPVPSQGSIDTEADEGHNNTHSGVTRSIAEMSAHARVGRSLEVFRPAGKRSRDAAYARIMAKAKVPPHTSTPSAQRQTRM